MEQMAAVAAPWTHGQQIVRPCWVKDMVRRWKSHVTGPSVPSHCAPRTTSYPASGMTNRSVRKTSPWTENGTWRRTPGQATCSPLATVAVMRGRAEMGSPVRRAAVSEMKLCEEPESRSAEKRTLPMVTPIWRVSVKRTPASAEREKQGDAWGVGVPATAHMVNTGASCVPAAALSPSTSSISTPSRKKRRRQNLLWPRVNFSLQWKHKPWRRRSAISFGVRRRGLPSPRLCWEAAGGQGALGEAPTPAGRPGALAVEEGRAAPGAVVAVSAGRSPSVRLGAPNSWRPRAFPGCGCGRRG